jgi:hypothetical protein
MWRNEDGWQHMSCAQGLQLHVTNCSLDDPPGTTKTQQTVSSGLSGVRLNGRFPR